MLRYYSLVVVVLMIYFIIGSVGNNGQAEAKIFEENTKFCLRTEPMLLADIEKHKNPLDNNAPCEIIAIVLTSLEKVQQQKTKTIFL